MTWDSRMFLRSVPGWPSGPPQTVRAISLSARHSAIWAVSLAIAFGCNRAPKTPATATGPADSVAVAAAATSFLQAFDSLNWDGFASHLSENVDAYWPRSDTADRLRNRQEVEARFHALFDTVRASRPGPPYLHLAAAHLNVRVFDDVGLVTFERSDVPDTLAWRTIVLHREGDAWRIVHLHASNLPLSR
jgi:hypothetical protein